MTLDNPAATLDESTLTVRRSIRIAAPVEKVWQAVTEPEHISRWFARTTLDDAGSGAIVFPSRGAVPLRRIAADAPRSVTYRWNNDDTLAALPAHYDDARATEFTFTLAAVDGGTELTVVETGFAATSDPLTNLRAHREGWTIELDTLVALLGGGQ
ncbi:MULTISPECIES: SRPBCC domain-containing protein [Microbacterium]|uniref:Activator of Hsp90 ATPase homologue 1/2-like C-terminal domain-containing protein n=1 Tax=Microbacterium wangchenii TaxID=2541726 RepID=A0ABX5SQ67_9MICO|nr:MULTISPECIES: SRPBCC domain-containing protein [Microbacterium]MCK6066351.1 SRPBCC domain-containing protein [Microbacterium sp. EYE_512]QBR87321.1 hypothetical protein E4K62_00560 [Microbacterium wangchenii]TXK14642.1 hypothetical protein FVP99_13135 [Microbacterium wangchenii]